LSSRKYTEDIEKEYLLWEGRYPLSLVDKWEETKAKMHEASNHDD
jgi:hypothetical protein